MARKKHTQRKGYVPKPWPRNPMEKLYSHYFNTHFINQPTPRGCKGCYICYKVERPHSCRPLERGVFENEFYPKKRLHAELCFLKWFEEDSLEKAPGPGEIYHVTWFMSWSPCVECTKQVVKFLNTHNYVKLSITFSRLYHSNKPEYRQGLRNLVHAGAELAVMSPKNFEYCWDYFVDNHGEPFRYWKGVRRNYYALKEQLHEILWE